MPFAHENRPTESPPAADPSVGRGAPFLLQPTFRGRSVTVGVATTAELEVIQRPVSFDVRDVLEQWNLIAIRDPTGRGTRVHALGWRSSLMNSWITSALTAVDLDAELVATRSGHAYRLQCRDRPETTPLLRAHLAYALQVWGFTNVRS